MCYVKSQHVPFSSNNHINLTEKQLFKRFYSVGPEPCFMVRLFANDWVIYRTVTSDNDGDFKLQKDLDLPQKAMGHLGS